MSDEILEDPRYQSQGYFDPWDYDEKRPKKHGPHNVKFLSEDEIEQARRELFENGSSFLPTRRSEIVGIDNVLAEIDQVIHWLRYSKEYQKYNSRLEPGVIFEGDPGTGKTLVSRYIATESDALFVNVRDFPHSGPLFRDSDIRDLFQRARATYKQTGLPIVLFWDEFENGACERANATPEQAATVSQLTAELDGVHGKNEGILLIGCTNYIYGIDQALRRSGRMGLQIEFHPPDRKGKRLLLEHYLGKFKTKGDIDVDTLVYFFDADATAADIEEAVVEAWRHAVRRTINLSNGRRKRPVLTQEDLIEVFLKRLVGPPTAFISLPLEDRAKIAVHEVGHALMALVYDIPLRLITVQPGKKSLGRTITAEVQEHIGTIDEMICDMQVGIGSIAAEQEAGLPAGIGTEGDIDKINGIAARLVENLNAGKCANLFKVKAVAAVRTDRMSATSPNVGASSVMASDQDVRELLEDVLDTGQKVMAAIGHDNLWTISNAVNEAVTMTGTQFRELVEDVLCTDLASFRP